MTATRSFQRSNELLATVATTNGQQLMARRRQADRRRVLLLSLSSGALLTLAVALLTGSTLWLGTTIVFDLAIGAYVMLLLMLRQRNFAVAMAPRIGTVDAPAAVDLRRETAQPSTVRVVAG